MGARPTIAVIVFRKSNKTHYSVGKVLVGQVGKRSLYRTVLFACHILLTMVTVDAVMVTTELGLCVISHLEPIEKKVDILMHTHSSLSSVVPSSAFTVLFCFRLHKLDLISL